MLGLVGSQYSEEEQGKMSGVNLHCTVHCSTQCGTHCIAVYDVGHSALQQAVWGSALQHAVLYSFQCGVLVFLHLNLIQNFRV
jgi:hypothetical protein